MARFGSHNLNLKVVVVPARIEFTSGHPHTTRAIRAQFANGIFDSEEAQASLGWSEEERVDAEDYLRHHRDFGRNRGIWELGQQFDLSDLPASKPCEFRQQLGGTVQQCQRPGVKQGYCQDHFDILTRAGIISLATTSS